MRWLLAIVMTAGLAVAVIALRCQLGLHSVVYQFVGDSWNPNLYVRACGRCGVELSERWQSSGMAES